MNQEQNNFNQFIQNDYNNQNSKKNNKTGLIILVLVVVAILAVVVGVVLNGNGNTGNGSNNLSGDNNQPSVDNNQPSTGDNNEQENNDKPFYERWGVTDHFAADNDKPSESFYINFPKYGGASRGYGLGGNQGDGTAAYIFGQNDYAPEISNLSELFPAYFEQVKYTLEKVYGLRASNFELSLTNNASTKVGNYDMHSFSGKIVFKYEGVSKVYGFVAYATTLKSNGAYAYWVVYDTSEEQSKGDLIAEHAYNMARTFREEQ